MFIFVLLWMYVENPLLLAQFWDLVGAELHLRSDYANAIKAYVKAIEYAGIYIFPLTHLCSALIFVIFLYIFHVCILIGDSDEAFDAKLKLAAINVEVGNVKEVL